MKQLSEEVFLSPQLCETIIVSFRKKGYLRKTDDKGGTAEKTGQMIPESSYSMAAKYMNLFLSQINDCAPKNIPMNR